VSLLFATEPPVPQRFGPYEVIRELGRGGMGVVYEGIHEELGRRAAIKVMRSRVAHAVGTARFLREARLGAQIRHPNIVDVFDIGVEAGMPFIVMELLEGETLASFLRRRGSLAAGEIVDIFLPLLSAVAAAHEAGTVHRDLKPGNVILARRG